MAIKEIKIPKRISSKYLFPSSAVISIIISSEVTLIRS
jgi:hypothetical protein